MNTKAKMPLSQVFEVDEDFIAAVCERMNGEFYQELIKRLKDDVKKELKELTTNETYSLQQVADLTGQSYHTVINHKNNFLKNRKGTKLPVVKVNEKQYNVTKDALKAYAKGTLPDDFFETETPAE